MRLRSLSQDSHRVTAVQGKNQVAPPESEFLKQDASGAGSRFSLPLCSFGFCRDHQHAN